MRTTLLPSLDVAAEEKAGAVPATVELLDTGVMLSETTSLPEGSWMALLSFELDGSA